MGRIHPKIDDASGSRKLRLVGRNNAPDSQDDKPRKLLEHLERENAELRACVVELIQQIRHLRGR